MSLEIPVKLLDSLSVKFQIDPEQLRYTHQLQESITSVRLNPFKPSPLFQKEEPVKWSQFGKYLNERPSFIADPYFHAGCYYVQEASSMFIEHILRETGNLEDDLRVLDLCAAPGGKSTLISSLISKNSLLVSNEIIKTRVPVLADNMTKWGVLNSVVTNNDPRDFQRLEGYFDIIVVDAPCSGSGMWRKDPQTINEWSEANVQLCSQRQQRILADVYPALKEGGLLIYSTCSYSSEENEDVADWLSDTFDVSSIKLSLPADWHIAETESQKHKNFGYRFYPHLIKGEGFFVSCFRKNGATAQLKQYKPKPSKPNKYELDIAESWISSVTDYKLIPVKEGYSAINRSHIDDMAILQNNLYLKKSGAFVGKVIGKDLVPDHELALSTILGYHINRVDLTYNEAIAYLRKDDLRLADAKPGWALMCYEGFGLGWAKILPNRINNYLPKELRILKEI